MTPETFDSVLRNDLALTALMSVCALAAVWLPLYRGIKICAQAATATRVVQGAELRRGLEGGAVESTESLALLMVRVLKKSLDESRRDAVPSEFVLDASKQYVVNEYDSHYAQPITMYANLLPPIGFIGTTGGLLILFLSMHLSNESLELGALAVALTSSIFALTGFAVLESFKIRTYRRLLTCLDRVVALARAPAPGGS